MKRWIVALAAVVSVMAVAWDVQASILYTGATNEHTLIRLNTDDGSATVIGGRGEANYFGVAYNGRTGFMYVLNGGTGGGIYTVDLATGQSSFAAPQYGFMGAVFSADFSVLYSLSSPIYGGRNLVKINPATGEWVQVGNSGIVSAIDLTLDSHNTLYAGTTTGEIYTIDQATGDATLVVSTVRLVGISFDAADNLFGITNSGDDWILVGIDLATGTTTDIGGPLPGHGIRGLDFLRPFDPDAPPPPGGVPGGGGTAIPEPSTLIIWFLLTALGITAASWHRRQ